MKFKISFYILFIYFCIHQKMIFSKLYIYQRNLKIEIILIYLNFPIITYHKRKIKVKYYKLFFLYFLIFVNQFFWKPLKKRNVGLLCYYVITIIF